MPTKLIQNLYLIIIYFCVIFGEKNISTISSQSRSFTDMELDSGDCLQQYCYDMDFDKPQFKQLGTKTPYRRKSVQINREVVIPNCRPIKIWMLCRHGARNMVKGELVRYANLISLRDEIIENYKEPGTFSNEYKRCKLCDADYKLIKNWNLNNGTGGSTMLKPQGMYDLKTLAENYRKMFPSLFDIDYSKHTYLFRHSKEKCTRFSYYAFVEGLLGDSAHRHIKPPIVPAIDLLLTPYQNCEASKNNSDTFDEDGAEPWLFEDSDEFQQMIRDVSLRLGFVKPLDMSALKIIWNMCGYEQSWYGLEKPSPWCAAFTPIHFNILDYREDLVFYYKKSYGSPINIKLACKAVVDMLEHLMAASTDSYKVVAYFVHSTMLQLFLTAINAFKDEPLHYNNYHQRHNRTFKSSRSIPLAANFAVVKYECGSGVEERVLFLLNQEPLKLSWCTGGLCKWSDVQRKYEWFRKLDCDKTYCDPNFKGFSASNVVSCNCCVAIVTGFILLAIVWSELYY